MNIRQTGEFVINMVPEHWAAVVQEAGEEHPAATSEVELLGLATTPSHRVRPPRLADSPVQFECTLERIVEFGSAPNRFVVGQVALMHVRSGLMADFKIDAEALAPLARVGGRNYARLGKIVSG